MTHTERILKAVSEVGGHSPRIFDRTPIGLARVRYRNELGDLEHRWGTSLPDLARRMEAYAKAKRKQP